MNFQGLVIFLTLFFNLFILGAAIYLLKYSRNWLFGLLFFLVNMILVLQIVPVGGAYFAERYTYISYIGLFFIIACLLVKMWESAQISFFRRFVLYAAVFLFTLFLSVTTVHRIKVWKDSLTLFDDVVNKYPLNYLGYYLRGGARQENDGSGAISDYSKSIEINPVNPKAFNNRGNIYSSIRKYQEALGDYNAALKFDSTLTEALNNRGAIKAILGNPDGALADIEKALVLKPEYTDAYRNRGLVKLQLNDLKAARNDWKKASEMGDDLSEKLLNRYPE